MIPVVISGGSGTRLWPVSRAAFPKQFCELLNESLLKKTLRRVKELGEPMVITVRDFEIPTNTVLMELGIAHEQAIYEPFGRNTAPAIALLCWQLQKQNRENEIVGVFPADHLISNEAIFKQAVAAAAAYAEKGFVVTLGITPDRPSTAFGYIEVGETADRGASVQAYRVAGFREKPNAEVARQFLAKGGFYWNAGIFLFRASEMMTQLKKLMPKLWDAMQTLRADLSNLNEVYGKIESQSIDYGVMEKLDQQICVACDMGWSDLGSWDDIARLDAVKGLPELNNQAEVYTHDCHNNFVFSSRKKVFALSDVDDLILIDTPDALLLAKKDLSQNVRSIVEQLQKASHPAAREHLFEVRPWGRFTILHEEENFKTKLLQVLPQAQISYQSHGQRSEHWVIVQGQGEVIINEQTHKVKPGDTLFIPQGAKHRIRNTSKENLELVEVQTGSYFGEDDIVRYSDDYKRV